ncbi:MAG: nuclear transport factor 2 family protein [Pseudonocardiaceae bacterium]|nr:nuclear transport factor 2 family protein [Pseudonocardiaceae bacterium]
MDTTKHETTTLSTLANRLEVLEDKEKVQSLQFKYGYLLDKYYLTEIIQLFADHPETEMRFLGGKYKGIAGVTRLLDCRLRPKFANGGNGPVPGQFVDHIQLQGVVTIAPDGQRAKGRFRNFQQGAVHNSVDPKPNWPLQQWWEAGVYENEYIKIDGIWRFLKVRYQVAWLADFVKGWKDQERHAGMDTRLFPENPVGPDEYDPEFHTWPETDTLPFHYPHPVTGEPIAI